MSFDIYYNIIFSQTWMNSWMNSYLYGLFVQFYRQAAHLQLQLWNVSEDELKELSLRISFELTTLQLQLLCKDSSDRL